MKRARPHRIPLAGYLPLEKLIEINRDALRATPKAERQALCRALITELIKWSSFSENEAMGVLETIKYRILLSNLKD
jgi:hypothetical protein